MKKLYSKHLFKIQLLALFIIAVATVFITQSLASSGIIMGFAAMTLLEVKDAKALLLEANDTLFTTAESEKRNLTKEEKDTVNANLAKIEDLDLKLETETRKQTHAVPPPNFSIKTDVKKEEFSLLAAIRAKIEQRAYNDVTRDVFLKGRQEFDKSGLSYNGDIIIPLPGKTFEKRADILAGTATQGQEIVAEAKAAILPPLTAKLVFSAAGARFLSGLKGTVSLPRYAGTTVAWKTEVASAVDGGGAFAEVNLTPLRITAYLDVSKTFLQQDGVGAEALLYDNMIGATARLIESTVLGEAIGVAGTQPGSFGYTMAAANANTEATVVPTALTLMTLEANVDTSNALVGNLAYITNPGGLLTLRSLPYSATITDRTIANLEGMDTLLGRKLFVTNSIASGVYGTGNDGNMVVFGNWGDLIIAQWGGYDITVDPYSQAITNQVRITINTYVDVKSARGTSGAGADIIEFPTSWDVCSIKTA